MARSLTVISLLFQSTIHCRYRVYTKFLLTYTATYRRNRKVLPLGITALQPQCHFHLGTPYILFFCRTQYPQYTFIGFNTMQFGVLVYKRPHNALAELRNIVHTGAAISMTSSLFGSAHEGQATLYLFQKHLCFRIRSQLQLVRMFFETDRKRSVLGTECFPSYQIAY